MQLLTVMALWILVQGHVPPKFPVILEYGFQTKAECSQARREHAKEDRSHAYACIRIPSAINP